MKDIESIYNDYTDLIEWAHELKAQYTSLVKEARDFDNLASSFFRCEYDNILDQRERSQLKNICAHIEDFLSSYHNDMMEETE